jgi:hypothetical protein
MTKVEGAYDTGTEDGGATALTPDMVLDPQQRHMVFEQAVALLRHAARLYRPGEAGLRYLPFRAAVAVAAASAIYADIGTQFPRQGPGAWDQRIMVSARLPHSCWQGPGLHRRPRQFLHAHTHDHGPSGVRS